METDGKRKDANVLINKTKPRKTDLRAKKHLKYGIMPIKHDKIQATLTHLSVFWHLQEKQL